MKNKIGDENIAITNTYIKSPLNYIGGKHKLLPQIIPLFPEKINTFVDLFGGGFNVGINVMANLIKYNDIQKQVTEMLAYFKEHSLESMLRQIDNIIAEYSLSKENQEGFIKLRKRYNEFNPFEDYDEQILLYVLICFAFNNQIRFNSNGKYNMPFGKNRSSFNPTLREKFCVFVKRLHQNGMNFNSGDYKKMNILSLSNEDLVYCDPPYFNSIATYNENGGWTQQDEQDIRDTLDKLNKNKIRFALSNNLTTNSELKSWAEHNGYSIHYLNGNYSNCNYQKKDKQSKDIEVLITNY